MPSTFIFLLHVFRVHERDIWKLESEEEKENESSRENLMKILVEVLRSMESNELADYLQNSKRRYTMGL